MLKGLAKSILKRIFFWQTNRGVAWVFINENEIPNYPDYIERSEFYLNGAYRIVTYKNYFQLLLCLFRFGPVRLIFTSSDLIKPLLSIYFLNVDYKTNPNDGWVWHEVLNLLNPVSSIEIEQSKQRFLNYCDSLKKYESSLIMGTGPSLAMARNMTEAACYKIVCNTIVKDLDLWAQLKPHFLVAGDAIYHYGHNNYAVSFRRDLKRCLQLHESLYVYPALYHPFLKKEFKEFAHLLVPIPAGDSERMNNNLLQDFHLPLLGNVLNLLLLPLATSLTKKVYLVGFDGRAPSDKLFWSNSNDHSYAEHIPDIQVKHPRFFDHFIDPKNPWKYVNTVHGDTLDDNLTALEKSGYEFISLAPSHTKTIQKRYKGEHFLR